MLQVLRPRPALPTPRLSAGHRVYAIGDVHGRLDLVIDLLARLEADDARRGAQDTTVLFLGDVIDRGPQSADVVELLMNRLPWADLICLKGNHEAAMLNAFDGDHRAARMWLTHGGREALASWGLSDALLRDGDDTEVIEAARAAVPERHRRWIAELPISHRSGDYLFVHAGVRPGVPIDRQSPEDCLWIRQPFLKSRAWHGAVVVHGHTVSEHVVSSYGRIGIDTGAYASGRLSAIGLEGVDRWILDTAPLL